MVHLSLTTKQRDKHTHWLFISRYKMFDRFSESDSMIEIDHQLINK
jgi:hypothetical protein